MNWHQQNALRVNWKHRKLAAHILADDYILTGKSLCGINNPTVYVERRHAQNPVNLTCKKCLRILERNES